MRNTRSTQRMKSFWRRVTRSSPLSYDRFDGEDDADGKDNNNSINSNVNLQTSEYKSSGKTIINDSKCSTKCDEAKESKKKRKGWKRIRHAALVTCRYIGMGVSNLSPPEYPLGDNYYGVSSIYHNGKTQPTPHWTSGIILTGW